MKKSERRTRLAQE